jgi:hypothetical protein
VNAADWPTVDVAVRQVARYQEAVVAAQADLDRAQQNLEHWLTRLAAAKAAMTE